MSYPRPVSLQGVTAQDPAEPHHVKVSGDLVAAGGLESRLRGLVGRLSLVDAGIALIATAASAAELFVIHPTYKWSIAAAWVQALVAVAPVMLTIRRQASFLVCSVLMVATVLVYPVAGRAWALLASLAFALFTLAWKRSLLGAMAGLPLLLLPTAWSLIDRYGLPGLEYSLPLYPGYSQELPATLADGDQRSAAVSVYVLLLVGWLAGRGWRMLGSPSPATVWSTATSVIRNPAYGIWLDGLLAAPFVAAMVWLQLHRELGALPDARLWVTFLACAAPAVLVLRRRLPELACGVLAVANLLSYVSVGMQPVLLVALAVALYSVGVRRSLLRSTLVAGVTLVAMPLTGQLLGVHRLLELATRPSGDLGFAELRDSQWPVSLSLILIVAWSLGLLVRLARENRRAALRETELVRQNLEKDQLQVLLEGRSEIARDLHDVVAHHVNLIVIQAETGPDLMKRDTEEILQGFQRIGDAGRKALGELDRMLSALRDAHGIPDPALTPQPGLPDLRALTDGLVDQGLPVSYELRGGADGIPDGLQLTAYRLVQEALTNVVKHAKASEVQVLVEIEPGGLSVAITDNGRGFDPDSRPDGRHGLTGMRERVRIHAGTLTITSIPGAGTKIGAWLPAADGVATA